MNPAEYQPLPAEAHAYIDGLLDADGERAFLRRLEHDDALRQRVEEIQAARSMLQSVALVEPPVGFDEALRERLRRVDLAAQARERIGRGGVPIWQRAALVALGALAASVAVVVILHSDSTPSPLPAVNSVLSENAVAGASEADLLPVFADQYDRFREFRRNVLYSNVAGHARRDLVRGELELSELGPRCRRLRGVVAGLPDPSRREYLRFFDSLASCCDAIDEELVRARNEGRELDNSVLNATLASVYLPQRLSDDRTVQVARIGPSTRNAETSRVSIGSDRELTLYLTAREAFYARDYDAAAKAYSAYLAEFGRGRFADGAKASRAVALLRAGYADAALDAWLADVRDHASRAALVDTTDQQLFRQAEQERQKRAVKPAEEDK